MFFDSAGNAWVLDTPTATAYEVWPTAVSRVSASDRYGTAVAISKREFPGSAPTVFVASGSNYPDALSGGPVAAAAGGPLLLTSPDTLPAVVSAEITRLSPSKIVVIGGPGAVSDTVLAALDAIAPATRIFGSDRYQTSRALVTSAFASAPTVYLATGSNFPDALAASGVAGSQGHPLLLVDGSKPSLDAATAQLMRRLNVQHIDLAGGTGVISPGVAAALGSIAPVKRLAGSDRFGTAEAINEDAYANSPTGGNALLATGLNFPDALAASAWAATKSPLYLSTTTCVPERALADLVHARTTSVAVVGGTGVLADSVEQLIRC